MTDPHRRMRLLLVVFTLDEAHPSLAWQVQVARGLADRVEKLVVLTSSVGQCGDMGDNVEIVVPPARPLGIPHRFGGRWAFNLDVFNLCRSRHIDAVFVHMAKNWTYQLKPAFGMLGLPVVMWYAHGTVTQGLRLAAWCANRIVTSTSEGCRLDNGKIHVIGQAIDTRAFAPPPKRSLESVLCVGRISRRKRVGLVYEAMTALRGVMGEERAPPCLVIGSARTAEDLKYENELRNRIWTDGSEDRFRMVGFVPHDRIAGFYNAAFLHFNVSETGSMDKSVMEALAAGCPVLTSNPAFERILSDYPEFLLLDVRPEAIAERILEIYQRRFEYDPGALRKLVLDHHSMETYPDRIIREIENAMA